MIVAKKYYFFITVKADFIYNGVQEKELIMFISLYSTYIAPSSVEKKEKYGYVASQESHNSFSEQLFQDTPVEPYTNQNLGITYISNYKSFANQQKLQNTFQDNTDFYLKKTLTMENAKNAYTQNTKPFSIFQEKTFIFDLTPKIDKNEPKELQSAKEKVLRNSMIQTYRANEHYFNPFTFAA